MKRSSLTSPAQSAEAGIAKRPVTRTKIDIYPSIILSIVLSLTFLKMIIYAHHDRNAP
jgi:hypothetical protein